MHRVLSVKLSDLNNHLKCPICKGYLIDAYTINECLHSFCKSCIIRYIKRKECCPVCKLNIIKERMNVFLKRDVNLQCIVYKLVPGLFKSEMNKRREFYSAHPKALKNLKKKNMFDKEVIGELDEAVFSSDYQTDISLSVEYSDTGLAEIFDSARTKELDPNAPKTYLLCPSSLTINILKKFISNRFDNKSINEIDVMYDDKPLNEELTLLDIAYIYAWRRTAPMRLFFRYTSPKVEPTEKSTVLAQIDNKLPTLNETESKKIVGENSQCQDDMFKSPIDATKRSPENPPVKVELSKENCQNEETRKVEKNETKQLVEVQKPIPIQTISPSETKQPEVIEPTKPAPQETEAEIVDKSVNSGETVGEAASAKTSLISTSTTTAHPTNSDNNSLTITAMVASIVQEVKNKTAAAIQSAIKPQPPSVKDKENEPAVLKSTTAPSSNNSPLVGNNKLLNESQSSSIVNLPVEVKATVNEQSPANITPQQGKPAAKRPKLIKPKADGDNKDATDKVVDQTKKKKARTPMENAAKKPRLSKKSKAEQQQQQQPSIAIKTEAVEEPQMKPTNPFPMPQKWPPMNPYMNNLVANSKPQTPSAQSQQHQQQQLTPEQQNYLKFGYNYSASPNTNNDFKPLPSVSNTFNISKLQHHIYDYFQNKTSQPGGYSHQHQGLFPSGYNPATAAVLAATAALASQYQNQYQNQHHYNYQQHQNQHSSNQATPFNYIDETFKRPSSSSSSPAPINPFASLFHDYPSSFFGAAVNSQSQNSHQFNSIQHTQSNSNRSFNERNNTSTNNDSSSSSGLDSLKETQLKISESCSLVNEAN